MLSAVYLIVTVTVDRPKIGIAVVAVIPIDVMDFHACIGHENESTGFTSSLLFL